MRFILKIVENNSAGRACALLALKQVCLKSLFIAAKALKLEYE
jgi:hypothetical protein